MVFHHGLGRSRGDSLFIAGALAGNGMVVAAIDAAKQGARSWCVADTVAGTSVGCASGVTCDTSVFAQQQGDPPTAPPGPLHRTTRSSSSPSAAARTRPRLLGGGNAVTSGSFLVSANFFRSRDTVRQDILDQSMLVRVLTSANGQAALAGGGGQRRGHRPGARLLRGPVARLPRGHPRPGGESALLPRGAQRGRRHHHRHPHHAPRTSADLLPVGPGLDRASSRARPSTSSSSSPRSGSSTRPTRPTSRGTS